MSNSRSKYLSIILGLVCVALLVVCGSLTVRYGFLRIQIAFALDQIEIFDQMRSQSINGNAAEVARYLEYVVGYYPSGTKQQKGSRLDQIVERERALAIRDLVALLRTRTGEDLGNDPAPWIQKYSKR